MFLTNKFPELNEIVMNEVRDTEIRAQLPENFPGLAFITTFAFALAETYLMWRAVMDPKKSTFLILYNLAAVIVDVVYIFTQGVSGLTTASLVWSAVTLIALLCARSEAEIVNSTYSFNYWINKRLNIKLCLKEYKELILEQLDLLDNITCKAMMGEFLLYYNNVLFGGIYDNRLLVKIVDTNKKYSMQEQIPYETAKPMYLVNDVDNKELLKEIIIETCKGLPNKK